MKQTARGIAYRDSMVARRGIRGDGAGGIVAAVRALSRPVVGPGRPRSSRRFRAAEEQGAMDGLALAAGALALPAIDLVTAALAVGALALGILVSAELFARRAVRGRGDYRVWTPHRRIEMRVDPEVLPGLEERVRFQVNRDGERGDETPDDWSDTYRVLVAGGSAAECYLLDQRRAWPHVIQEILAEPESLALLGVHGVHVGSIAHSLAPCFAVYHTVDAVLGQYQRLDLVVLMVGASDVVAWLQAGTPGEPTTERRPAELFAEHPEGPFGWRPRRTALARLAARAYRRLLHPVERRAEAAAVLARGRVMRSLAPELIDEVPDPEPMLALFDSWLRSLILRLQARGARVVLARQPWFDKDFSPREQACMWNFARGRPMQADGQGEVPAYYSHAVVRRLMRLVDQRAARVARDSGADQVDLMACLEPSLETYYDFLHFTPSGARAVARAIAETILAPYRAQRRDKAG